ncbi:MAG: hypothetical protein HZR80_19670 [Candidatus Heimdallarchaeota archaeon]
MIEEIAKIELEIYRIKSNRILMQIGAGFLAVFFVLYSIDIYVFYLLMEKINEAQLISKLLWAKAILPAINIGLLICGLITFTKGLANLRENQRKRNKKRIQTLIALFIIIVSVEIILNIISMKMGFSEIFNTITSERDLIWLAIIMVISPVKLIIFGLTIVEQNKVIRKVGLFDTRLVKTQVFPYIIIMAIIPCLVFMIQLYRHSMDASINRETIILGYYWSQIIIAILAAIAYIELVVKIRKSKSFNQYNYC